MPQLSCFIGSRSGLRKSTHESIPLIGFLYHTVLSRQRRAVMAGRFEGVSDLEWRLFEDVLPPAPPKRSRGMPHAPFRTILNTLLYVLMTGCRWCDVPRGP